MVFIVITSVNILYTKILRVKKADKKLFNVQLIKARRTSNYLNNGVTKIL